MTGQNSAWSGSRFAALLVVLVGSCWMLPTSGFAQGCNPPSNLNCDFDPTTGVYDLTWVNNDAYDSIRIICDGVVVANLPGTDVSYGFTPPAPINCCSVQAFQAGVFCGEVECCPGGGCSPPSNLACDVDPLTGAIIMNWTNNSLYSSINIICDGILVTTLPGTDTSYTLFSPVPVNCCVVQATFQGVFCGEVECCPGMGCLPPSSLACDYDTSAGVLFMSWTNASVYGAIEILCDGILIATLPGTDTSYPHVAPPGSFQCCVVRAIDVNGNLCGERECCPQFPCVPPSNLACDFDPAVGLVMNWTNNSAYGSIEILCDGVLIATLPGTDNSYIHTAAPGTYQCCIVRALNADGTVCGEVECCPQFGCVPPSNLTCDFDPMLGLVMNWTNNSPYGSIEILCDGVLIATLPGTDNSYIHTAAPGTYQCCVVRALNADGTVCGERECCPQFPCVPPSNLTCDFDSAVGGLLMNWTNNSAYGAIEILCDNVLIATLPGTDTSYVHVAPPGSFQCCVVRALNADGTVCGEVECCPQTDCDGPSGLICEFDPATGVLLMNWTNNSIYTSIVIECDGVTIATLPGTATSHTHNVPAGTTVNCCRLQAFFQGNLCGELECCIDPCIAPTDVDCVVTDSGDVVFTWTNNGTYTSLTLICNGVAIASIAPGATSYTLTGLSPGDSGCCFLQAVVNNQVCDSAECCYDLSCEPITDLTCTEIQPGLITLSWTNNSVYSHIDIFCDGVFITALSGTDTTFTVPPPGATCCTVIAYFAGTICSEEECCLDDPGPCPGEDIVVVLNTGFDQLNGVINVGDPDDDWVVTHDSNPSGNSAVPPFVNTVEPSPAIVRNPNAGWAGPLPASQWIFNSVTTANGLFHYEYCFCLRDGFSDPTLALEIYADDWAEVFLNGVLLTSTPNPGFNGSPHTYSTNDASLFVAGVNCVKVIVHNTLGVDTGFNAVGEVTAVDGRCCCEPPPYGMVGWWPLDEQTGNIADDIVGPNNGNHLGATPLPRDPEFVDYSLDFDGMSFVEVNPVNSALDFGPSVASDPASGDFSIDAWVRPQQFFTVNPIVSKMQRGTSERGYTFFLYENKQLALEIRDASGTQVYTSQTGVPPTFGSMYQANTWYHVTVTVDRDQPNGVKFYVNGFRADDDLQDPTGQGGSLVNNANLYIAHATVHSYAGGAHFFQGNIDEVEIFDRVLSSGEIRGLVEARQGGKCKEFCHVPWDKPVASSGTTTVGVTVCNNASFPQTYNVSSVALPSPTPFCSTLGPVSISHAPTVTVPAGGCVTIPVTLTAPFNAGISCYEMCFENDATGAVFCCRGSLVVAPPVIIGTPFDPTPIDVGISVPIVFPVTNPDPGNPVIGPIQIIAMSGNMDERFQAIGLDGLPPGTPVTGTLDLPGGGTGDIMVEALTLDHEPFVFYDIILMADFDGDGDFEPLASYTVRTVAEVGPLDPEFVRGDCNGDGMVNIADAINLLGILFNGGGTTTCQDACDTNDDGMVNIADAINLLGLLFGGGSATLPAPFPDCGPDPTTDNLDCVQYTCP